MTAKLVPWGGPGNPLPCCSDPVQFAVTVNNKCSGRVQFSACVRLFLPRAKGTLATNEQWLCILLLPIVVLRWQINPCWGDHFIEFRGQGREDELGLLGNCRMPSPNHASPVELGWRRFPGIN